MKVRAHIQDKIIWLFLLSFLGGSIFGKDYVWSLTANPTYLLHVHESKGKWIAYLKHKNGTWDSTNPFLLKAFEQGLELKIAGTKIKPKIVNGVPPSSSLSLNYLPNSKVFLYNKELKSDGKERALTNFDIRRFANDESYPALFNPTAEHSSKRNGALTTDLHTHLAGHLQVKDLVEIGKKYNLPYPTQLLDEIQIRYPTHKVKEGKIAFKDLVASEDFANSNGFSKLEDAMSIESSRIRTFGNMEDRYRFRSPITKNVQTFADQLWAAAKTSADSGVKYVEFSISNIIDPAWLEIAHQEIPKIENARGVKLRFVVGLWRHSDPEWNLDEIARTQKIARASPYIVGIDFMGHETNTSKFLGPQIEAAAALKSEFPGFQVRVHAGENALYTSNVREAAEQGANRVGHGIYVEKDQGALLLDPQTQTIAPTVIHALRKNGTVIELNPASNQALNNLNEGSSVLLQQFQQLKIAGIPVVLGTDGVGMYGSNHEEVSRMLTQIGFTESDMEYVRESEKSYLKKANETFEARQRQIANTREKIPSKVELESHVDQVGRKYTPALAKSIMEGRATKLKQMIDYFHQEKIYAYDSYASEFQGMKAIDVSGGSMSQFATLEKEGRLNELQIPRIRQIFKESLRFLDPKKVFFLDGGTQFGVEKILHEEVFDYNRLHPETPFKIVGVLPADLQDASPKDVYGPHQKGITHYKIGGKDWSDFATHKLELLEKHGGAKVAIAGKMFVADEFRNLLNADPKFKVLYQKGPLGASTALAQEHPAGAYENTAEFISKLVGDSPKDFLKSQYLNHSSNGKVTLAGFPIPLSRKGEKPSGMEGCPSTVKDVVFGRE